MVLDFIGQGQIVRNLLDDFVWLSRTTQLAQRVENRAEVPNELCTFNGLSCCHISTVVQSNVFGHRAFASVTGSPLAPSARAGGPQRPLSLQDNFAGPYSCVNSSFFGPA